MARTRTQAQRLSVQTTTLLAAVERLAEDLKKLRKEPLFHLSYSLTTQERTDWCEILDVDLADTRISIGQLYDELATYARFNGWPFGSSSSVSGLESSGT